MKTDCFPGIVSLVRALMKSRTGVRKSDTVVNYLVRATSVKVTGSSTRSITCELSHIHTVLACYYTH